MTDKEIDLKIHRLLGLETKYEIRVGGILEGSNLSLKDANVIASKYNDTHDVVITSSRNTTMGYVTAGGAGLRAAEELAKRYDFTFVLTYNKNEKWRAAFGDYKDCEEVEDENPTRATCLAIIKFMENRT